MTRETGWWIDATDVVHTLLCPIEGDQDCVPYYPQFPVLENGKVVMVEPATRADMIELLARSEVHMGFSAPQTRITACSVCVLGA